MHHTHNTFKEHATHQDGAGLFADRVWDACRGATPEAQLYAASLVADSPYGRCICCTLVSFAAHSDSDVWIDQLVMALHDDAARTPLAHGGALSHTNVSFAVQVAQFCACVLFCTIVMALAYLFVFLAVRKCLQSRLKSLL